MSKARGVTFSGETFNVPLTHDMLQTLFDPTVHKSACEIIIVSLLVANSLVFYFVADNSTRITIFVGMYIFWRLMYNFGIGFLLNRQLNCFQLVEWAKQLRLFEPSKSLLPRMAQAEVSSQMGPNYLYRDHPVAFNTWLIFRKAVDLILMLDFTTFMCVFVACCLSDNYQFLRGQPVWIVVTRLSVGTFLIVFNFWVKVNAHNTIKDYAWYWGDFFFRQINNEDLIFDGVFEMFPHPMYSVGYVGYYGFALIAKSYTVLCIAIFGHFLQMVFLHYIENPHIDKIYGPSANESSLMQLIKLKDLTNFDNLKPLVGFANFNIFRASDIVNLITCATYAVLIPLLVAQTGANAVLATKILFGVTLLFKSLECVSINAVLVMQSNFKTFTKWYLANNVPVQKSLNNFAVLYNSLINLTYASFAGLNFYKVLTNSVEYTLLSANHFYLRLFLGALLVLTQIWINISIVDLIGYFGWFYGDFFVPKSSMIAQRTRLTKAGVYRYLNNPEQVFGVCGVMGVTLIVPTPENLVMCVLWVANNFIRINFIEKQHMIRIYGEQQVSQDSGVTKTVKKHLLPETLQRKLAESPRRKTRSLSMIDSFDAFIKDLRTSKKEADVSKQNLAALSQNKHFAQGDYKVEVSGLHKSEKAVLPWAYAGDVLEAHFTAPKDHSAHDWIGLYKVTQTSYSKYRTLISSRLRWSWAGASQSGVVKFEREKLFWEDGVFEFRYHLDGKHNVVSISEPFEIRHHDISVPMEISRVDELASELKSTIFDKIVQGVTSTTTPIFSGISKTEDVVGTYTQIAKVISSLTGIKVNKRFLIYNDNESGNLFNIEQLAAKLIQIRSALRELEDDDEEDLVEKKEQ